MAGGGVKINNITVSGGADGKTPTFKIEDGVLYNSYDGGVTWRELGTVKGEDGENGLNGATGAKIVSQVFQGEDENGGYIYLQTFDDGTSVYFTAPRGAQGDSGVEVYTYHAGEYDDWFTRVPESIPDGGLEQLGDTSYCEKTYDGQRDVRVGDIVILYSPNANSRGQHSVLSIMNEVRGADNCVFTIIAFIEGEQGIDGNFIYNTAYMMDGYTQSGQEDIDYNLQYISASKIDLTGRSRAPRKDDYIIAQNFTTNDSFALFKVDSVLEHRYYYCSRIAFITGARGVKGDAGISVVSANITEVQASAGGGLTALVAGETIGSLAFDTTKTADEMTAFFNSLTEWQDMGGVQGVLLVIGGSDVPLLMAVNTGTFYALFSSPDANTICVYASEPFTDMGVTEAGWQNLTDGVLDFSATPWEVSQLSQESLWNGSIAGKSGGATVQSTSREKTYNLSLVMSDSSVIDAGNFVVTDGRSVQSIAVADEGLLITYDDGTTETLSAEFTDVQEIEVDSTPTEDSNNLVTSGGVYAFVSALTSSVSFRGTYQVGETYVKNEIVHSAWSTYDSYFICKKDHTATENTAIDDTENWNEIIRIEKEENPRFVDLSYNGTEDLVAGDSITVTSSELPNATVGDYVIVHVTGHNTVVGRFSTTYGDSCVISIQAVVAPAQSGGSKLYKHSFSGYIDFEVGYLWVAFDMYNRSSTAVTVKEFFESKTDGYLVTASGYNEDTMSPICCIERRLYEQTGGLGWFDGITIITGSGDFINIPITDVVPDTMKVEEVV